MSNLTSRLDSTKLNERKFIWRAIPWVHRMFATWHDRRVLESLPDHILKDIGIGPSEIPGILIDLANGDTRRSRARRRL